MDKFVMLAVALMLTACGQVHQTDIIKGNDGKDGISIGIDVKPATTCTAGGTTLKTFVDDNANGELDTGESVKKTATICNGTNGLPGTSVTVDIASNTECATGGIVVTLGSNKSYVCNGADGSMGPQGATGATGPQGPQGVSGSIGNLTPVQLCPGDTNTSYPEYGFIVGTNLYAVYFDKNQPIAFLSKLNTGNYVTTNGSNCYFTYANNGSTITLTNSNNTSLTTVINLSTGSSSTSGGTFVGKSYNIGYCGTNTLTLKVPTTGAPTINGVAMTVNGTNSFKLNDGECSYILNNSMSSIDLSFNGCNLNNLGTLGVGLTNQSNQMCYGTRLQ